MSKLADRSICVVNLGKDLGSKVYRLYDPKENRIYVSKDVVFEESKPWAWDDLNKGIKFQKAMFHIPAETVERQVYSEQFVDDTSVSDNDEDRSGTPQESDGKDTPFHLDSDNYDDNVEPRKTKAVVDVYNDTEEVITEEELYLMGVEEPANYHEASKDRNWSKAMAAEIDSIERNNTWTLTELPSDHKVIGLKWIFKLKKDAEGIIIKHMARLVAKGYALEHEIDYDEVYAPMTRLEMVRLLLALAVKRS